MVQLENRENVGRAHSPSTTKGGAHPPLTPNQKMVYEKLRSVGRATGAYELLGLLRDRGVNAAPTVYRALHELESKGLVRHLVATRQFIALAQPRPKGHSDVMLVCEDCQGFVPLEDHGIVSVLNQTAVDAGFEVRSYHLELIAVCAGCRCMAKEGIS